MARHFGEQWTILGGDEEIHLSGGESASELLARHTLVVPFASAEVDVAVEVLILQACAVVQLGLDVLRETSPKKTKRAGRSSARKSKPQVEI
jgi:hypothetical protein